MQLLSEFFRDAISRVVPGLVAIFILGQQFTATMPAKFNDSPTIFAFVIVVAAWLIGVMIDFLPVAVLGVAMRKLASSNSLKAGKFTRFLSRKAMEYHEKNLPVTPRTHEEVLATALRTASRIKDQSQDAANRILWDSHRQIQKHDAEKIMFFRLPAPGFYFRLSFASSALCSRPCFASSHSPTCFRPLFEILLLPYLRVVLPCVVLVQIDGATQGRGLLLGSRHLNLPFEVDDSRFQEFADL